MRRLAVLCLPLFFLPAAAFAQKGFDKAVTKVTATFHPAEAKPGQTVTLKLTVELAAGYHTYPLVQTDPKAKAMVNTVAFPAAGAVVFVGDATDPEGGDVVAEPLLGILAMKHLTGTVVYERPAVVAPTAAAGQVTVTVPKFVVSVCDHDNCFPPKTLTPEATLTVLAGPAVAVEAKYAAAVKAAAEKK